MFYAIYKITNQVDGKIYIGSHKTENLDDNYMGSGKYLKRAQEKYGIENFTKEILFVFDNPDSMYVKEAELVNEDFLASENTYNLKLGGFGGWDFNNTKEGQQLREHSYEKWRKAGSKEFLNKFHNDYEFRSKHLKHIEKISKLGSEASKKNYPNGPFSGKKHSNEFREYMSGIMSVKQNGKNNSQYGTRWIYSTELKLSKKVAKNDPLPEGWNEGRKIKF